MLDRDYRTDEQVQEVHEKLGTLGVTVHVWRRKELESYLLEPHVIATVLGVDEGEARSRLDDATKELRDFVTERATFERARVVLKEDRPALRRRVEASLSHWERCEPPASSVPALRTSCGI